jgi:hypothetical protein
VLDDVSGVLSLEVSAAVSVECSESAWSIGEAVPSGLSSRNGALRGSNRPRHAVGTNRSWRSGRPVDRPVYCAGDQRNEQHSDQRGRR